MPKYCMPAPAHTAAVQSVTSLDNAAESPTTALYRAAIGPINNDYYLPIFKRFEATDRVGPSWNLAASLYTLNWMAFRHLWGPALAYIATLLGAAILVLGVGRFLFQISETTEMMLWVAIGLLSFLVPGFYGNALLHAASRKKMARALATSSTMVQATAWLNTQASTRRRFVWLALVNFVLASMAIGIYMMLEQAAPPQKPPAASAVLAPSLPASTPVVQKIEPPIARPAPAPEAGVVDTTAAPVVFVPRRPIVLPDAIATTAAPIKAAASAAPAAQTPGPASNEKSSPPLTQSKQGKTYYVNVGLFADELNANNAKSKLSNAGLAAFTEELKMAKGKRTRVRVGPFDTESKAAEAANKIRLLKLDAMVIAQLRN